MIVLKEKQYLLKKYNAICNRANNLIGKTFGVEVVYDT